MNALTRKPSPAAKLRELVSKRGISYGIVQPGEETPAGIPIVRVNNMAGNRIDASDVKRVSAEIEAKYARTRLQGGEVLLSLVGTLGLAAIAPPELKGWNVARAVAVLPVDSPELAYWIVLNLRSAPVQQFIRSRATTTVQATFNLRDVAEIPIPMPPESTRRRICGVASAFDDKIELNRRMNEVLEAMARAIFKSWFVDFDPVRAKSEGRQPQGIPAHIADLFPSQLIDSPLGPIPKGWSIENLEAVADINPTLSLKKGASATYVDMKCLPTRGFRPEGYRVREFTSGSKFQNGDTLLARITPCLENGKTGFVDFLSSGHTAWGSTEFIVIRPHKPIPAVWGYLLARDAQFRNHAITNMTGSSGRQRVPPDVVSNYEVVRATKEVYEAFAELVEPMFKLIGTQADECVTLANTRNTLLPRLLSGEVR